MGGATVLTAACPARYALLQRAKGCVEKLLAFYPAPTCHERVTASVCVANVAYSPILFKAAIIWGDPEVFQWLLNARQGFIMLADYSKRVTWTAKVNLERQGLETLLCVRHTATARVVWCPLTYRVGVGVALGRRIAQVRCVCP